MSDLAALFLIPCVGCPEPSATSFQPSSNPTPTPALLKAPSDATETLISSSHLQPALQPDAVKEFELVQWSSQTARSTPPPVLKPGSRGQAVSVLQTRLKQLGHNPGSVDGLYGSRTRAAVMQFQQAKGLQPDGVVGAKTWAALEQSLSQLYRQKTATPAASPEPQAAPARVGSPAETTRPSEPSINQKDEISSTVTNKYFWILGWLIIYGGGWVLILKDVDIALRGRRVKRLPQPPKMIEPVAKQTDTQAKVPAKTVSPKTSTDEPQHQPHERVVDQQQQALKANDVKQVFDAPVADLFRTVDQMDAMPNEASSDHSAESDRPAEVTTAPNHSTSVRRATERKEILVATLPFNPDQQNFTYKLLDDISGLFVLNGNELRVIDHRLAKLAQPISHVLTVRQTDKKGMSIDTSFKVEIKKKPKSPQSQGNAAYA